MYIRADELERAKLNTLLIDKPGFVTLALLHSSSKGDEVNRSRSEAWNRQTGDIRQPLGSIYKAWVGVSRWAHYLLLPLMAIGILGMALALSYPLAGGRESRVSLFLVSFIFAVGSLTLFSLRESSVRRDRKYRNISR